MIGEYSRCHSETSLKFYISAYVKINLDGRKYIAEHFQSKATLLTKAEIIEEVVKSHCNIVHDKIEEYYKRRNAREIVGCALFSKFLGHNPLLVDLDELN